MPSPLAAAGPRDAEPLDDGGQYSEPLSGMIISVILSMISLVIISIFLSE